MLASCRRTLKLRQAQARAKQRDRLDQGDGIPYTFSLRLLKASSTPQITTNMDTITRSRWIIAGRVACHGVTLRDRERLYTNASTFRLFQERAWSRDKLVPQQLSSFFLERDQSELGDHVGLELDVQHKSACWDVIDVLPKSVIGKSSSTRLQVVGNIGRPAALEDTLDISLRKIVADEEQAAGMLLGDLIGKTVTEVQAGRIEAFAPMLIGLRDTPSTGRRDRDDLETEPVDQTRHLFTDIPPGSNDEGLRHRAS